MPHLRLSLAAVAILAAAYGIGSQARAQGAFVDGVKLYDACSTVIAGRRSDGCGSYIMGVIDTLNTVAYPNQVKQFCLPDLTIGEIADVVAGYVASRPEERKYWAASLVIAALAQAFPCKP
jgi:hypothetical protein